MSLRPIALLGDPVLRRKARKVTRFDQALQTLIEDMVETMREANGIGLAAPQVNVLQRVIVVELPEDEEVPGSGRLYVLVNPEILRASEEMEEGIEGCLSIPGYIGEVLRHSSVVVRGQDRRGKKVRIKAEGLLARVLQHEIDHLNGVLYIDKLTAPDRIWRVEEGEEEEAEARQEMPAMVMG